MNGVTSTKDVAPQPVPETVALEDMDVDQLKAYAEENQIDIGKASSQEGILKKINEAEEDPETDEPAEE